MELRGKGSDRVSRNGRREDEKRIWEEERVRTGQSEERRRTGGRSEKVLCLVKLRGHERPRRGGMGQRGMKEFCCSNE